MAVYGQYETVTELARSGSKCVYRARPADGAWDLGFDDLGTDATFVIKTYRIRNADDVKEHETKRFLECVRAQKRTAANGGAHWVPILEAGRAGNDAFYVAPYFARTAAKLAQERNAVDGATLYAVVSATLEGLLEIRRLLSRPHGNLKSTNIMIGGTGKISAGNVLLTDLAREEDATIAGDVEDLYNLGEVIHELVLGEKFAGQHNWPIAPSRRWTQLGKSAAGWLELCNHLLSPRAAENWLRVDDIMDEVAPLRPRRKPLRSRKALIALAALLVVGGAATGEYFRYAGQWRDLCGDYVEWVGPLSNRLALDTPKEIAADPYLQEHLVRVLAGSPDKHIELDPRAISGSDQPLALLADHPPLSFGAIWKTEKAWRLVRAIDRSLSPDQWTDLADLSVRQADYEKRGWRNLAEYTAALIAPAKRSNHSDWAAGIAAAVEGHARLARLETARQTARARIEHLEARLANTPALRDPIGEFQASLRASTESDLLIPASVAVDRLSQHLAETEQTAARFDDAIPLLADAARRQRAYEVRGWLGAANWLSAIIDRAHPTGNLTTLSADLTAAKGVWEQVENRWLQIEQRRRLFETSGDRVLATYRQFLLQSHLGEQPDLVSLSRRLEEINDDQAWAAAAEKVAEPAWAKIDVVEFAQKSEAHRGFAGKTVATTQDLRTWLNDVEGYGTQLASATVKPDLTHGGTGETQRPIVTVPKSPTTMALVTPTTSPVKTTPHPPSTLAVVTPNPISTVKPPTTVTSAVTKPVPTIDPEKERLDREIAAFITECREVGLVAKTAELKNAWRAKNEEFALHIEKDRKAYSPSLKAERDRLRGRLLQLDSAYQSAIAPLALKQAPGATWGPATVKSLQASMPKWSEALKDLAARATSNDAHFDAGLAELIDNDEQWRAAAARLLADASRADRMLADGVSPLDKVLGANLSSALAALRSNELYKNEAVRQSLEPLTAPVALVESQTAAPQLRQLVASGDLPLGIRLAAWTKTASNVSNDSLGEDIKLSRALLADAQKSIADKVHLSTIKGRLEADVRGRWESLLDGATNAKDIEAAIAMRDQITGVDLDKLAPRARFNIALHDLRTAVAAARGEDIEKQIAPAAQKVKQVSVALDPAQAKQAGIASLLAEIDRLGRNSAVDVTRLGPLSEAAAQAGGGKIAWSAASEESGDKLSFRASLATDSGKEDVALVFRRVHPGSSSRSSWVCTSEASLGLFCDLVTTGGKWGDVRAGKLLADYDPSRGDPRQGPRVWEWPRYGRTGGIVWTRVWLGDDFIPRGLEHYPVEIAGEFNFNRTQIGSPITHERAPELNPSRRQPMQQVSAKAAMLAAAVAGCRLPTIAEWQAAYQSVERKGGNNLRDRAWRLELEHMSKPAFKGRRPDAGMFVPVDEKPSDAVYARVDGGESNDGVLWFREVPASPSTFVDLVGNVGEFVTDESEKVYVIGGSALSPPSRAVDRPFALGADQASSEFSDVGFRLAFSEPVSGIDKLKDAVAGNWYLTPR